jgi:hypothetical protein
MRQERAAHVCSVEACPIESLELCIEGTQERTLPLHDSWLWRAFDVKLRCYLTSAPGSWLDVPLCDVWRTELLLKRDGDLDWQVKTLKAGEGLGHFSLKGKLKDTSTITRPLRDGALWLRELKGSGNFAYADPKEFADPMQALMLKRHRDVAGIETYFEGGPPPAKRRREFPNGGKDFYGGIAGQEALCRVELPSGRKQFYEGIAGQEALCRAEFPSGEYWLYGGAKGQEAKRGVKLPGGKLQINKGIAGEEALWLPVSAPVCIAPSGESKP